MLQHFAWFKYALFDLFDSAQSSCREQNLHVFLKEIVCQFVT